MFKKCAHWSFEILDNVLCSPVLQFCFVILFLWSPNVKEHFKFRLVRMTTAWLRTLAAAYVQIITWITTYLLGIKAHISGMGACSDGGVVCFEPNQSLPIYALFALTLCECSYPLHRVSDPDSTSDYPSSLGNFLCSI
jgi:hypothetical protein